MNLGEAGLEVCGRCVEELGVDEIDALAEDGKKARVDECQRCGCLVEIRLSRNGRAYARHELGLVTEFIAEPLATEHVDPHDEPLAGDLRAHATQRTP
ncbi:MAG: hypothetical protein IPK07_32365 [Deltaproteobacteria bacterium]|nr:hypothetical protein [Deltaproteobacteria bacterium]